MKILQINTTFQRGSTGRIASNISSLLDSKGIENYIIYTKYLGRINDSKAIYCGNSIIQKINSLISHIFGCLGFEDWLVTTKVLKIIKRINPTLVHLHNIHSHNINIKKLFKYLQNKKIQVVWTFHDCWAFTGYCMHFDYIQCEKWKSICSKCPQFKCFSYMFDFSKRVFLKKKTIYSSFDMTIVTPSNWLANLVKKSFLGKCDVEVINNGINLDVFRPTPSNIREKYNISSNAYVLLGVSFGWNNRKGLDVFINLAKTLPTNYQIVLVGVGKSNKRSLPSNIISLQKTHNQKELAELYSASDLFVNPTREDTFPTVNMEALACGTPVLTFRTGGSPEIVDGTCGSVVERDDIDSLTSEIIRICTSKCYSRENCLLRASSFDEKKLFSSYVDLYMKLVNAIVR